MSWADDNFLMFEPPDPPEIKKIHYTSIVHETNKAILFKNNNGNFWIPKSVIMDRSSNIIEYEDVISIKYIKG